jgi:uncharacterized protein YpmS
MEEKKEVWKVTFLTIAVLTALVALVVAVFAYRSCRSGDQSLPHKEKSPVDSRAFLMLNLKTTEDVGS